MMATGTGRPTRRWVIGPAKREDRRGGRVGRREGRRAGGPATGGNRREEGPVDIQEGRRRFGGPARRMEGTREGRRVDGISGRNRTATSGGPTGGCQRAGAEVAGKPAGGGEMASGGRVDGWKDRQAGEGRRAQGTLEGRAGGRECGLPGGRAGRAGGRWWGVEGLASDRTGEWVPSGGRASGARCQ